MCVCGSIRTSCSNSPSSRCCKETDISSRLPSVRDLDQCDRRATKGRRDEQRISRPALRHHLATSRRGDSLGSVFEAITPTAAAEKGRAVRENCRSIHSMKLDEAINKFGSFSPTGDEALDLRMLQLTIDQLGELKYADDVRRELITIFERNPNANLGSPGPIVHALEESPVDEHVALLAESLRRHATVMTVWMAERCFRSNLSTQNRRTLVDALRSTADRATGEEVVSANKEALQDYGT